MESAIRDLSKTVLDLQNTVTSLQKVVLDQNVLIKKLVCDGEKVNVNKNIEAAEGRCASLPSQRPIRDARIRAAAALSVNARKGKGGRNISPALSSACSDVDAEVFEPADAVRTSTSDIASPVPSTLAPKSQSMPSQAAPAMNHARQDAPVNENVSANADWTDVKSRRSQRADRAVPTNVTRGTATPGSTACLLSAAERKSYLHLYYVLTGTSTEQVMAHLLNICPGDNCSVEALKSRGDYASFKLTVPSKNINKYLSPEHWAEDVHIKPWRSGFRKPMEAEQKD